jgi:hypothetical protein
MTATPHLPNMKTWGNPRETIEDAIARENTMLFRYETNANEIESIHKFFAWRSSQPEAVLQEPLEEQVFKFFEIDSAQLKREFEEREAKRTR